LNSDPLKERIQILWENCEMEEFHDALWAILRLPKRPEDLYDHWGYDKNCGYNEALADVRETIAQELGVK
jgi:hypothetical protein